VKHLILALLAATFSLSALAGGPPTSVTEQQSTAVNSSRSNIKNNIEIVNPTKEQVATCNAKKDAKEKKACQQKYGIAVSDPGTPSTKTSSKK
jgi:hypothetical protein